MSQDPVSDKIILPSINIQNPTSPVETYYGRFRSIVKQRFFGLKLEEDTFMEFIDSNPVRKSQILFIYRNKELKERLGGFTLFMDKLKGKDLNRTCMKH